MLRAQMCRSRRAAQCTTPGRCLDLLQLSSQLSISTLIISATTSMLKHSKRLNDACAGACKAALAWAAKPHSNIKGTSAAIHVATRILSCCFCLRRSCTLTPICRAVRPRKSTSASHASSLLMAVRRSCCRSSSCWGAARAACVPANALKLLQHASIHNKRWLVAWRCTLSGQLADPTCMPSCSCSWAPDAPSMEFAVSAMPASCNADVF